MSTVEQEDIIQDVTQVVTVITEQKDIIQDVKIYTFDYGLKYLLKQQSYLDSTRGLAFSD